MCGAMNSNVWCNELSNVWCNELSNVWCNELSKVFLLLSNELVVRLPGLLIFALLFYTQLLLFGSCSVILSNVNSARRACPLMSSVIV